MIDEPNQQNNSSKNDAGPTSQESSSAEATKQKSVEQISNGRIGFGKRFIAVLIDGVISAVVGVLIGNLFAGIFGGVGNPGMAGLQGALVGATFGISLVSVLYGLIEGFTGASPGKMILKIIIRNENGSEADQKQLFTRYAIKNISVILSVLSVIIGLGILSKLGNLLGFIVFVGAFAIFSQKKQTLHDILAKTAVYQK